MVKIFATAAATTAAVVAATAAGASVPDGTWPTSTGDVYYTEPYTVAAGETFDGELQTFQRSDITCKGQEESGSSTAVFLVEAGGTLKNVIIGADQMEGVHCDDSDCTIENVWWDDVCEDALSIKGGDENSVSTVTGGGARSAGDKVVQHNGYGTVTIDGFYAEDFGKLYRSCGTCGDKQRFVTVSNVYAVNPGKSIITVNQNYGDEATLSNIWITSDDDSYAVCAWSKGNEDGEPEELGDGISDPLCQYSESDIHVNGDVSTATSTSTTATSSSSAAATTSSASATTDEDTASPSSSAEDSVNSNSTATDYSASSSDYEPTEEPISASSTAEETSSNSASTTEEEADEADVAAPSTTEETSSLSASSLDYDAAAAATSTPSATTGAKCNGRKRN